MDLWTAVVAITGFFGFGLIVLSPVLVLMAAGDARDWRFLRRHAVQPCASLRPGAALSRRVSVFGRSVPGPGGTVVAPFSGTEAVWYRAVVYSVDSSGDSTRRVHLWDDSRGDPFAVADGTGAVAVSAGLLQASVYNADRSMLARTRSPAGSGPVPAVRSVDESTGWGRRPGPWLRQILDRGLIRESARKGVTSIEVVEDVVLPGVPVHVIGKPVISPAGEVVLTLPRAGRYLMLSCPPEETARALAADSRYGLGAAFWALLVGAALAGVCVAVARQMVP